MGFIENLLDSFSSKDLKSRIRWVIAFGVLFCIIAAAGMYLVLVPPQRIAIQGTGRWETADPPVLSVSIDSGDLKKLANFTEIEVEALNPPKGLVEATCQLLSIEPAPPAVRLGASGLYETLRGLDKIEVNLVLMDVPLWKMLWGGR